MSLSAGQLFAISSTERTCSTISLLATSIIIISFASSTSFRKPINRLVFYASFGNIMANVATLISQSGIAAGPNSNLCQIQAFLIQWFMPADALWTFAMAFNVYLTFFRKYNSEQLRRLEWKYVVLCYGLPFIPAFTYFFIHTPSRGKVYGSAILWCWVAPSWDFLRIALFYGPVWLVIFVTLAIYARIGNLVWRRRRQLKEAGGLDTTIDVSIPDDPPFSKITEIFITREDATSHRTGEAGPSTEQPPTFSCIQSHRPYSVSVQAGIDAASQVQLERLRSVEAPEGSPEHGQYSNSRTVSEVNTAAWAYTKYAMLFFVALLVTWVPSTINRVYAFIRPEKSNLGLNYASSFVLPLQAHELFTHQTSLNHKMTTNPPRDAHSPSPPPQPPIAQTPGPRVTRLQEIYAQALARTLRANSYANFAGCFPTPAKHVPASLENVWRQLNAKLEESAKAEFEDILVERDAIAQLNELDRLVGEARVRRERRVNGNGEDGEGDEGDEGGSVPPHTLPPDELFRAHLTPQLEKTKELLDGKIQSTEAQNVELAQRVQAQRAEIERLLAGLEMVVADVEGAAVAATEYGNENNLRKEALQMDEEVKARADI
ncbi:putative cAMP receptor-like protein [Aspergillus undulatus]|uniref:putative cAMP receptor-like protein n=1 Tax=Aspergillus undulatus TaxID=1810928 RepID=UPI003CCE0EE5